MKVVQVIKRFRGESDGVGLQEEKRDFHHVNKRNLDNKKQNQNQKKKHPGARTRTHTHTSNAIFTLDDHHSVSSAEAARGLMGTHAGSSKIRH